MQKEMDRLLMERSLIERELDCSQHDPIEVVLIFDKSNSAATPSSDTTRLQKKKRKRTRPRPPSSAYSPAAGGGGQGKRPKRHKGKKQKKKQQVNSAEVYYDPTKLKFVFSTPSPLSRKFLEMRDRTAVSGEEELSIYDMADMPLSTGSAGKRPISSSDGPPPPHALQLGKDRRVQNETS